MTTAEETTYDDNGGGNNEGFQPCCRGPPPVHPGWGDHIHGEVLRGPLVPFLHAQCPSAYHCHSSAAWSLPCVRTSRSTSQVRCRCRPRRTCWAALSSARRPSPWQGPLLEPSRSSNTDSGPLARARFPAARGTNRWSLIWGGVGVGGPPWGRRRWGWGGRVGGPPLSRSEIAVGGHWGIAAPQAPP
eukprot:gene14892-biopygen5152